MKDGQQQQKNNKQLRINHYLYIINEGVQYDHASAEQINRDYQERKKELINKIKEYFKNIRHSCDLTGYTSWKIEGVSDSWGYTISKSIKLSASIRAENTQFYYPDLVLSWNIKLFTEENNEYKNLEKINDISILETLLEKIEPLIKSMVNKERWLVEE